MFSAGHVLASSIASSMFCTAGAFASSTASGFATCLQGSAFEKSSTANFNRFNNCTSASSKLFCTNANQSISQSATVGLRSGNAFPRILAAAATAGIITTWHPNVFGQPKDRPDAALVPPMGWVSIGLAIFVMLGILGSFLEGRSEAKRLRTSNKDDEFEAPSCRSDACEILIPYAGAKPIVLNRAVSVIKGSDDLENFVSKHGRYLRYALVENQEGEGVAFYLEAADSSDLDSFLDDGSLVAAGRVHCLESTIEDFPFKLRVSVERGKVFKEPSLFSEAVSDVLFAILSDSVSTIDHWPNL